MKLPDSVIDAVEKMVVERQEWLHECRNRRKFLQRELERVDGDIAKYERELSEFKGVLNGNHSTGCESPINIVISGDVIAEPGFEERLAKSVSQVLNS